MTSVEFYNEPVTVTATINHNGYVTATHLIWQDNQYPLTAAGRQWQEEDGRHVLVEAVDGSRFELQLDREDLLWRLRRAWLEAEEMAA